MSTQSNTCPECGEEHCPPIGQLGFHEELDVALLCHQCSNCGVVFETCFEPVSRIVVEE